MQRPLRAAFAAGLILISLLPAAHAKKAPRRGAPLRIRRIRIIRRDLFDTKIPSENKKVFRFVNALHISTKESAIREELLMKPGDLYNADLAKESERLIRSVLKLRNVKVTPVPIDGKTADLLIVTQETWTTEPQFGFSGVGSTLNFKAGVREQNLLGYGKDTSFYYKKTAGVISRTFSYDDPRLAGTPLALSGDYEDGENGAIRKLSVIKPFTASITHWSAGAAYADNKHDVKSLDNTGATVETLRSEDRDMSGTLGFAVGSTTRRIRRPLVGYRRLQSDLFHTVPRSPVHQDLYHVFRAGIDLEKVNFLTATHIQQYDRDEDFALGPALTFEGGAARRKWVPTSRNANFFTGQFQQGAILGPSHFVLLTTNGKGKFQEGAWRSSRVDADGFYFNHFQPRQTLACHLGWSAIVNPLPGDQLLLGGDTGLRGYKINQFAGNKKVLANAEDRFYVIDDVAHFMSVGWVAFADGGYIWAPGRDLRMSDVKADVGTGMRIYLNRTSQGHVLRFDLAYAVKRVGEQSRMVFTFGTSQAF